MEFERLDFRTPADSNYFFGYYDKSQISKDGSKLLALKTNFMDRLPGETDSAWIGYFLLHEQGSEFVKIAETRAFNWQQGCMLQWLGPDHNSKIIYNDLRDGRFVSITLDLDSVTEVVHPLPIYTVAPDGINALTVDYERHYFCRRGYSYGGIVNEAKNQPIVKGDGIWRFDLNTSEITQIFSIDNLLKINFQSNMENATHYLEHLMFNPSGNRFCFLHRWKMDGGGIYARLYTANIDGTGLYLLNDSGRMSHFCWRSETELVAYGGLKNPINMLRKYSFFVKYIFQPFLPIYHKIVNDNSAVSKVLTGDSYILFRDKSNQTKRVALELSREDGHPSFNPKNVDLLLTDTYPDPNEGSVARLYCYNLADNKCRHLDSLNSIPQYDDTPIRCDLHPRWSYDGNMFSVDTMNDGMRGIYVYRSIK